MAGSSRPRAARRCVEATPSGGYGRAMTKGARAWLLCALVSGCSSPIAGADTGPDAPPPDAPLPDAPLPDAPAAPDAPFDPSVDDWRSCDVLGSLPLEDALGVDASPSSEMRSAFGVGPRFGIVSDRRLSIAGTAFGRVVAGTPSSGDLYVAVIVDGPGAPIVSRIDRNTLGSTPVTLTNFPTSVGATVTDAVMVRLGAALRLALLIDDDAGSVVRSCDIAGSECVLGSPLVLATTIGAGPGSGDDYRPTFVAIARQGSTVTTYTASTTDFGAVRCWAEDGGAPSCDSDGTLAGDGAESTGDEIALLPFSPSLLALRAGSVDIPLVIGGPAGVYPSGSTFYDVIHAEQTTTFDLGVTHLNCSSGGSCLYSDDLPIATAQPGTARIVHVAPNSPELAFVAVGVSYAEPGTDVRLYGIGPDGGVPLAAGALTLGTGRVTATPGTLSSLAVATIADGTSIDVFTVAVAASSSVESVYLSGIRYCL